MPRFLKPIALLLLSLAASGCATVNGPIDERDPWEEYNRSMFEFNDSFDRHILKPVAEGYNEVVPPAINNRVSNVFSHLDDVIVILNDILQLKVKQTLSDISRFSFNTVFGLFGLFDVADHMGLPKHNEDFGQTLGHWGVGSGPYLVLPFLGPSTLRDGTGLVADWQVDPVMQIEGETEKWATVSLEVVDTRANLLRASRILDTAALDRYVFMRDAYLQRRNSLVYDGNPPMDEMDDFDPFAEDGFDPTAEPE